ncbi:hypothetical protein NQ318_020509 [Aromia moschata]|uniref:Uncharacterized protein n=1 Tax=Aromia moschata TaxID=1265417 RepID=A0AAV8Z2K9_9CUCU|nr:hypothetical protein NQ318_020509 [Aromia moschata]
MYVVNSMLNRSRHHRDSLTSDSPETTHITLLETMLPLCFTICREARKGLKGKLIANIKSNELKAAICCLAIRFKEKIKQELLLFEASESEKPSTREKGSIAFAVFIA